MEATLPDDFLGNLAELTKSLQNINVTNPSNIDLSGTDDIPNMKIETNIKEMNKKSRISTKIEKIIETKPVFDPHGDFKVDVKELAKIEDMVKEYSDLIKELKKKKDVLRQKTIDHMVKHEIDVARMNNDDRFNLINVKRTVSPSTKTRLPANLEKYFIEEENKSSKNAKEKAQKICKWLDSIAEVKTDKALRRYKGKNE
jgi:hypothetical protein